MSRTDDSDAIRRERSPLRDDQMERILEDFFRREMPPALRGVRAELRVELRASTMPATFRGAGAAGERSRAAGLAGVGATALALCLGAVMLRTSPPQSRTDRSPVATSARPNTATAKGAVGRDRLGDEHRKIGSRAGGVAPDGLAGEDGPVELRPDQRVRKVWTTDPETGDRVEVELPELTIEIVPIKD